MNPPCRVPRRLPLLLVLVLAAGQSMPASAYQTYGVRVGGRMVTLKWGSQPVRYHITSREVIGVTGEQFRDAAQRAFSSWQAVPGASVSAQFAGFTSADPFDDDGMNTLGFLNRPDLDRVLGATTFLVDRTTGEILESDIFFNSAFSWSVAQGGDSGRVDLESIILHETGHLFGLGHSSLGETELRAGGGRRVIAAEAVMFPIAFSSGSVTGRTLRADDMAGISELYPRDGGRRTLGSVSGRVTKNGQGVFGAHVVAFNPGTGKLVGSLTMNSDGGFTISSLEPGAYILRIEPLDDVDLDSFFSEDDVPRVDRDFKVAYAQELVLVAQAGGTTAAEIKVVAK
jgi:hypothetical protein